MKTPQRIWITGTTLDTGVWHDSHFNDWNKEYIRADLVAGLVEALESCLVETKTYGDQGYVFTQHFDEQKVIAALAALKEER